MEGHGHWKSLTIKDDGSSKKKGKKRCEFCLVEKDVWTRIKYGDDGIGLEIMICNGCYKEKIEKGEDISEDYNF